MPHSRADVDMAAGYLADSQDVPELLPGTIVAWSPKSRARLADLDYTRLYGHYPYGHYPHLRHVRSRLRPRWELLPWVHGDRLDVDRPQQPAADDAHPDLSRRLDHRGPIAEAALEHVASLSKRTSGPGANR